jgi:hypothetical protein
MSDLSKAAITYLKNRNQSLTVEQQVLLAFSAGAVYGSDTLLSVVEVKALMLKIGSEK